MTKFNIVFKLNTGRAIKTEVVTLHPLEEALEDEHVTRFEDDTEIKGKDISSVEVQVKR